MRINTHRPPETRAEGEARFIEGYAAVFYREGDPSTEYELWEGCFERVMPTAFREIPNDVCAFWQHDSKQILGRNKAGTLKLEVDDIGLRYSIRCGTSPAHINALEAIERGDIDGSSFSFNVREEAWKFLPDRREIRELIQLELLEVSPVTWPAYSGATAGARDKGDIAEARLAREAVIRSGRRERFAKLMEIDAILYPIRCDENFASKH